MSDVVDIAEGALKTRLSDSDIANLRSSGLSNDTIIRSQFRTERNPKRIADILRCAVWRNGEALVIPYFIRGANGEDEQISLRIRPTKPVKIAGKSKKTAKYLSARGARFEPYFPLRSRRNDWLIDTSRPLFFTEGEKKAAKLDELGFATIGAPGVDQFHDPKSRDAGSYRLHPRILDHAVIAGRSCLVVFDSDVADNKHVLRAAKRLAAMLDAAGAASVRLIRIPCAPDGAKLGVDDFAVRFGDDAARALLTADGDPIDRASLAIAAGITVKSELEHAPVPDDLLMPAGYELVWNGIAKRDLEDPDAEPRRFERAPIFISHVLRDIDSDETRVELVFERGEEWTQVVVDRIAIADARSAVHTLAPLGAPITSASSVKVVEWLGELEHVNAATLPRSSSVSRFGWHRFAGDRFFVLDRAIGTEKDILFDRKVERRQVANAMRRQGDRDTQADNLRRAVETDPICALAIFAVFAAPLIDLLGAPNFALHLAGDSSRGKSSMIKIAASVFGDPKNDAWIGSWSSTDVGREHRAATLCDLPFLVDEAGVISPEESARAVYALINGVGKTRGARAGGLRETLQWRTIVVSTGERELVLETAPTGAQARVLSMLVEGFGKLDAAGVDALRVSAETHFGHLGLEWIQWIVDPHVDWQEQRDIFRRHTAHIRSLVASENNVRARQAEFIALLSYAEKLLSVRFALSDGAIVERWARAQSGHAQGGGTLADVRPAAERAVDVVREWLASRRLLFPTPVRSSSGAMDVKTGTHEIAGFRLSEGLAILPHALRSHLAEHGLSDRIVVAEWKRRGWLVTSDHATDARCTTRMRIMGCNQRVILVRADVLELEYDALDDGYIDTA